GPRVKIQDIQFEGNKELKASKLRRAMKDTKRRGLMRIFKKSKFQEFNYEDDKKKVIAKYNSIGMRNASIVSDTFYLLDNGNMMIKMKVDEGEKFYFGNIEWVGNTKYRSTYLDTILGIKY